MKNLVTTLLAILFFSIFNFAIGQDSLKIMTYNIQGMKPGTMPGFRLAYIINEIKDIDPDIIGLQEINESIEGNGDDNQCNEIAEALTEYFNTQYTCYQQFTHLSWDNQFRESIGIITKYPVIDSAFNQFGVEVAVLSDTFHQAGKYVAELESSKLPNSIYFCTLKSNKFVQTKIMSVVR